MVKIKTCNCEESGKLDEEKQGELKLMLEESIVNYRATNAALDDLYRAVKSKIMIILGGSLALLTYLYSSDSLFLPEQLYGRIIYAIGLGLVLAGISMLYKASYRRIWAFPVDIKETRERTFKSYIEYLYYVEKNFIEVYEKNSSQYTNVVKWLHWGFVTVVLGAILLIVIKFFSN